jgi:RNA polymerase sigma factor (sigma-70 family)
MWLIRVTSRECHRARRQERPHGERGDFETELALAEDGHPLAEEVLGQVAEEQALRDAVSSLTPQCRELVSMLFYDDPPRSYVEAARALGVADGSVAFLRARCLTRLRRVLEKARLR